MTQDDVQGYHWSNDRKTLHSIAIYMHQAESPTIAHTVLEDICDKPIRIQSYCTVARLHGV
jgi:hypothetical protein